MPSASTFVWLNVIRWTCAHSVTLDLRLCVCVCVITFLSPVLQNKFNTCKSGWVGWGVKAKTWGRADRQESETAISL